MADDGYINLPIPTETSSDIYRDLPYPPDPPDPGPPGGIPVMLWLDGTDPLGTGVAPSDGTKLAEWKDKSGNVNDFSQPTSGNQPAYRTAAVNLKGAVQFTIANNNFLNYPTYFMTVSQPFDFFFMLKPSTVSGGGTGYSFFYTDKASNNQTPVFSLSPTDFLFFGFVWQSGVFPFSFSANTNYLIEYSYTGGSIGTNASFVTTINNSVIGSSGTAGGNSAQPTALGSDGAIGDKDYGYGGYICEVLFYNNVLSPTDRTTIQNYLSNKWGY